MRLLNLLLIVLTLLASAAACAGLAARWDARWDIAIASEPDNQDASAWQVGDSEARRRWDWCASLWLDRSGLQFSYYRYANAPLTAHFSVTENYWWSYSWGAHHDIDTGLWFRQVGARVASSVLLLASVLLAVAPAFAFLRGPVRRIERHTRGLCHSCGYNLKGNVSGVCPECGTRRSRRWWLKRHLGESGQTAGPRSESEETH